jgi:hypothetical protein
MGRIYQISSKIQLLIQIIQVASYWLLATGPELIGRKTSPLILQDCCSKHFLLEASSQ